MKTNQELQHDVENAIKWEPLMHDAEIGVSVKNGVVSLSGTVDSYVKKMEAENASKKVKGVKAIVEHIEVKFPSTWNKADVEVANEILEALKVNYAVPNELIQVKVENGWVTLEGELTWNYERESTLSATKYLNGVKGITNHLKLKPTTHDTIEKEAVELALKRNALQDVSQIKVAVNGTTVTLTGTVNSWYQKEEAGRIAWNTPGIWNMKNDLVVEYDFVLS